MTTKNLTIIKSCVSTDKSYLRLRALFYALGITKEQTVEKVHFIVNQLKKMGRKSLNVNEFERLARKSRKLYLVRHDILKLLKSLNLIYHNKNIEIHFSNILLDNSDVTSSIVNNAMTIQSGEFSLKAKFTFSDYVDLITNAPCKIKRKDKYTPFVVKQFEYCEKRNKMIIGLTKSVNAISEDFGFNRAFLRQRLYKLEKVGLINSVYAKTNKAEYSLNEGILSVKEVLSETISSRKITFESMKDGRIIMNTQEV